MSGLYNIVLGDGLEHTRGAILRKILGDPEIGRFRDAWVERSPETGDPIIAIYTRNGGGNREHYDCDEGSCTGCVMEKITGCEFYIRDVDDSFDSTYATIYFRAPEPFEMMLREAAGDPVNTDERWKAAIALLGGE
jgi:hypothetical protein